MAKYDHIDFAPPQGVQDEAAKGLAWRREHGRGGTEVGVARARDLSNGTTISPDTARRMKAYFDRHEVDKQGQGWSPKQDGFPSAGRIAWALWGGDSGYSWSKKLVSQMNAADESQRSEGIAMIERRCIALDENESEVPLLRVEKRAGGGNAPASQDWIVGYAAKFGARANLGDFVEQIDPGAFGIVAERRGRKKPLETRALWNHDANYPLARYPDSLRLTVDDIGLRYEFPVPNTTYGRDVAENIRAGIVKGSSFAFTIAPGGEQWDMEEGRSVRTVTAVGDLIDVGPVVFPAYAEAETSVAKRSLNAFLASRARDVAKVTEQRTKAAELREYLRAHGR